MRKRILKAVILALCALLALTACSNSTPVSGYTVTYYVNGTAVHSEPGETASAASYIVEDDNGWNFSGWHTASGEYYDWSSRSITSDLSLHAHFTSDSDDWDGTASATLTPSEDGIYYINSAEDLACLASLVNNGDPFSGKKVELWADLDLNTKDWTPIGTADKPFSGDFEGNGHSVDKLSVSSDSSAGLFGCVSGATIRNLTVAGGTVKSSSGYAGGIVAYADGSSGSRINIINCSSNVVVEAGGEEASAGGIVGYAYSKSNFITIEGCSNNDFVMVSSSGNVGGIVGYAYAEGSLITIIDCTSSGYVSASESSSTKAGGIAGYANGSSGRVEIISCTNTGSVAGYYAGGIAGYSASALNIITSCNNASSKITGANVNGTANNAYTNGSGNTSDI